jgi:hypothetical protein
MIEMRLRVAGLLAMTRRCRFGCIRLPYSPGVAAVTAFSFKEPQRPQFFLSRNFLVKPQRADRQQPDSHPGKRRDFRKQIYK